MEKEKRDKRERMEVGLMESPYRQGSATKVRGWRFGVNKG
jgi:hypothetical protein